MLRTSQQVIIAFATTLEMNLQLKQLSECPEFFSTVLDWVYVQWWKPQNKTLDLLSEKLKPHLNKGTFEYTVVAIIDGVPVGSCCVFEHDCSHRPQYSPWVGAVYVKPTRRLQGVATNILQKTLQVAESDSIKSLYLVCENKISPLYEKNGWKILEKNVGQKDSLIMYRSTESEQSAAVDVDKPRA